MGVLKSLTDEYFGKNIRKEDEIDISGLNVEIVSFTDNNKKHHNRGYKVKDGNENEMARTLINLIKKVIEKRGNECDLNDIDVSNIKRMNYYNGNGGAPTGVFETSDFNCDISGWNVSGVKDMKYMFFGAKNFNQDIGNWNVSNVENMMSMFGNAKNFNQPLKDWGDKLGNVEDMSYMFWHAENFNQDIGNWNVSGVKDMKGMFSGAKNFNQPLKDWGDKLGNVEYMGYMFDDAEKFNQNLSDWQLNDDCDTEKIFDGCPLKKNPPEWYKE